MNTGTESSLSESSAQDSLCSSVVDPDTYVFGPPGSGSVIILYRSSCGSADPSINKQKK
jgi:hypothetical protein